MRTWILTAHRSGARLFQKVTATAAPDLVEVIDHPEGRLKDGDIDADRPGRSFDRFGPGRHAMSHEDSPSERVADAFARQLAGRIETGAHAGAFDALVLVAEPRFLGRLRHHLAAHVAAMVTDEIAKDVPEADAATVERLLEASVS